MGWRCWSTYFQPNPIQACPAGAVQSSSALFVSGADRPHLRRAQPTSQVGRYNAEALQIMLGGKSIADALAMTMDGTGTKAMVKGSQQHGGRQPKMFVHAGSSAGRMEGMSVTGLSHSNS